MGTPKQHVMIGGKTFLERITDCIEELGEIKPEKLVFVGSEGDTAGQTHVKNIGGRWLTNFSPELGTLSSVKLALDSLGIAGHFMLWPVDHPLVTSSTVMNLIQACRNNPDKIIVPSFDYRRGHPVIFPPWAVSEIKQAPMSEGARWVLRNNEIEIMHIVVRDRWTISNINTPEDLQNAREKLMQQ